MEQMFSSSGNIIETANHVKHGACSKNQMSRSDFLKACFALTVAPAALMMGCGGSGSSGGRSSGKIKMTTEASGEVRFSLAGNGVATVDWGDGSEKVTLTINEKLSGHDSYDGASFRHTYPSASIRTITVNGDNIEKIYCGITLTDLDVSRCAELTFLGAGGNLTSLDVRKNTALTSLSVMSTQLTSLDVSKNIALTSLSVRSPQLMSLDVSKNTALTSLVVGNTQLTSLDVSKNTALEILECNGNTQLTSLNANGATALTKFVLNDNSQLTSLNVSGATALTNLECNRNTQLTSLDISGATVLTRLGCCCNQLTSLDLSKNTALEIVECPINQLTAAALNALFGTLHSNTMPLKSIDISHNPGSSTCDRSIAINKGWNVRNY